MYDLLMSLTLVDDSLEIVSHVYVSSACVHACVAMFMVYESRAGFKKRLILSTHHTECVMSVISTCTSTCTCH